MTKFMENKIWKYRIPFNKPFIVGKELYYIAQSVRSGHTSGNGPYTKKCQALLERKFGAKKVLLTTSCSTALEMAAILCDIRPGDEVILPSFTFVSTANAFHMRGAKLVFVDIRSDTLNIDEAKIAEAINERTKIIVPVHYAGASCEMNVIKDIAKQHKLMVVEDAAQAVNSKYKDHYLGTIGDFGTFSFHETKNFICGEGGAIVINNEKYIERAEIVWEKGTNRAKFFRGEVDKYTWVDIGSSYVLSDILAAFLYAQLEKMEEINQRRQAIFDRYYRSLMPLTNDGLLRLPTISYDTQSNSHLFYIIAKDRKTRDEVMGHFKKDGIHSVFHYLPLHLSPVGRSMGYAEGQLPVTESLSDRLLRLPFYYDLTPAEQTQVIESIKKFFTKRSLFVGNGNGFKAVQQQAVFELA